MPWHGNVQEDLTDHLVDLRHWAKFHGVTFSESIRLSLGHYLNELLLDRRNEREEETQ